MEIHCPEGQWKEFRNEKIKPAVEGDLYYCISV